MIAPASPADTPRTPETSSQVSAAGGWQASSPRYPAMDLNLDDAPPPSLHRLPSPAPASPTRDPPPWQPVQAREHRLRTQEPFRTPPPPPLHPWLRSWSWSRSRSPTVPALAIESPTPIRGRDRRPDIPRVLLPVGEEEEEEEGWGKALVIRVTGAAPQIVVSVPEVAVSGAGPEIAVSTPSPPAGQRTLLLPPPPPRGRGIHKGM